MHAVHDPGYTHGRCERPDRRRQGGHFQPDAQSARTLAVQRRLCPDGTG